VALDAYQQQVVRTALGLREADGITLAGGA
jgi:hypothetical protein